jgi:DNA-directed RNA polymerase specialized sigma24 family protein
VVKENVADLYWLATLLTGSRGIAADVALQVIALPDESTGFAAWIHSWSRRLVIAKALAAVRKELADSAARIASRRVSTAASSQIWMVDGETTKPDLERALLSIDVFPRAVLLLLIFERVPLLDAATLLDSEPELLRSALAAGVQDLTKSLAMMQDWKAAGSRSNTAASEESHV